MLSHPIPEEHELKVIILTSPQKERKGVRGGESVCSS